MTNLRHLLRTSARHAGWDVSRYRPLARRRASLLEQRSISLVLDVGANRGQYGRELRTYGYRESIVSFEPLDEALTQLRNAAASDPHWEVRDVALGATASTAQINVASNLASSSLLPMLDSHRSAAPGVTVVARESVRIVPLDEVELPRGVPTLLKLDVQGYEDRVLDGASRTLGQVAVVECELSIVPLYADQLTLRPMLDLLSEAGFELVDLEPGQRASDGATLYIDALFRR